MCENVSLNSSVKQFNVDGIDMIGNMQNGSIIGLDEKGINFINAISKCRLVNEEDFDLDEKVLFDALKENLFLQEDLNSQSLNSAYVHVTDNCNLHCVGCYSFVDDRNCKEDLSFSSMCKVFDKISASGVSRVVISGGEPFLREDLADICKYAKQELKIDYLCVITNGTMPIEKYERVMPFVDEISVSIDGYSESTRYIRDAGIMPKVIDTINRLKDKVKIHLISTLHKKNKDVMDKYVDFSRELGVTMSFSIFTVDNSKSEFDEYQLNSQDLIDVANNLSEIDKSINIIDFPTDELSLSCRERCEAGRMLISIDAKGDIYPCHMLHTEELKLGNVLKDDIVEVLNSDKNDFKELSVENFQECYECNYKYLCGGGCRGRSYYKHNRIDCSDSYCEFMKNYHKSTMEVIKQMVLSE